MNEELNFNDLSNSEIKIKMKEMENEYEHIKAIISEKAERMDKLNDDYIRLREILNKRSKTFNYG